MYDIIRDSFNEKQILKKYEDILSIYSGVAICPQDGKTKEDLYQHSKYAKGFSKKSKTSNITFFSQELFKSREKYLKMLALLKRDIDHILKTLIFYSNLRLRQRHKISTE